MGLGIGIPAFTQNYLCFYSNYFYINVINRIYPSSIEYLILFQPTPFINNVFVPSPYPSLFRSPHGDGPHDVHVHIHYVRIHYYGHIPDRILDAGHIFVRWRRMNAFSTFCCVSIEDGWWIMGIICELSSPQKVFYRYFGATYFKRR